MTRDSNAPHSNAPQCTRTAELVDRIVDERLRPEDREHAAGCARCGPVLQRAQRFDDELRRVAGGFVGEELPRGILDPGLSATPAVTASRGGPGLAGILAAVAVMVVAMTVAIRPGGPGNPTPGPNGTAGGPVTSAVPSAPAATPALPSLGMVAPPLRSTEEIGGALIGNDWGCSSGRPLETAGTNGVDHEGIVCSSPKSMLLTRTVVVTGESASGDVLEVTVTGELVVGTSNATEELAEAMSKAAYLSIGDSERAPFVGDWVLTTLPEMKVQPSGDTTFGIFGEVRLTLELDPDGSYLMLIQAQPR